MSIEVRGLKKSFGTPPQPVLRGLDFRIEDGEFVSITGRSGCGKSALLYLISSLDHPTEGSIRIDGHEIRGMSEEGLHRFRNEKMGFIFQFHYLLPELTALENVLMPARRTGAEGLRLARARELLARFDLSSKENSLPSRMSGGEQQRVAIARALIMEPRYVFADEPTGNLDSVNGGIVLEILKGISRDHGTTVVMVTHDKDFAAMASRRIEMVDGKIVGPTFW